MIPEKMEPMPQQGIGTGQFPDRPILAVGAVVFKDRRVLLVQRGHAPAKGMWAIPGGKVNLGETLKQAAEREIFEETGIRVCAREPIWAFESMDQDPQGRVLFHYYIVDLDARYLTGDIVPGDDAADARWVSEAELERLRVNRETRNLLTKVYQFG